MTCSFVADVGGTNIRLASVQNGKIQAIKKYLCKDFDTIKDAIEHAREELGIGTFAAGCIGIACPVNNDLVKMTNHSWSFSKVELKQALGLNELFVINDFTAVAFSLPGLSNTQLIQIGNGKAVEKGNIAVFGPGTGLGVEHLTWTTSGWQTLDGEGGHVDFAPNDENDLVLWKYLMARDGRASAEELMSGRGIVTIYTAFCEDLNQEPKFNEAAQISNAALSGADAIAEKSISQLCRIMGAFAGNLAVNLCTTGGVFIGGGIAGKLGQFLVDSDFRAYFERKGVMAHYVENIPTYIIDEPDHGLLGALAYLIQQQTQGTQQ